MFVRLGGNKREDKRVAESIDGRTLRVVGGDTIHVILFDTPVELEVQLLSTLSSGVNLGRTWVEGLWHGIEGSLSTCRRSGFGEYNRQVGV